MSLKGGIILSLAQPLFSSQITNEEFLKATLDAIHDGLIITDLNGTIIYANSAYTRILGVNLGKVINKKMRDLAPEALALKVMNTGKPIIKQPLRVPGVDIDVVACSTPIYENNHIIGAVSIFKDVTEIRQLNEKLNQIKTFAEYLQEELEKNTALPSSFQDMIGKSGKLQEALVRAVKASKSNVTVMVRGETGVGKELVAKAIHNASERAEKPFIKVNCAAIPENLLESELFGYEDGAFTGAKRGGKPGKFELAHTGTLFLDEIGDMSLALQAKLLRAIQEKEIERIGGIKSIPIDVRIIVATNQDLEKKVQERTFREDLYYRLNVYGIKIPPLRERKEDIPLLIFYFLNHFSKREKKKMPKIPQVYIKKLIRYCWPGNVRELQNTIECIVVSCESDTVEISDFPDYLTEILALNEEKTNNTNKDEDNNLNLKKLIAELEYATIIKALKFSSNNCSKAIKMLNISRSTFYEKLSRYKIKISTNSDRNS